jgi:hypothetical protein
MIDQNFLAEPLKTVEGNWGLEAMGMLIETTGDRRQVPCYN